MYPWTQRNISENLKLESPVPPVSLAQGLSKIYTERVGRVSDGRCIDTVSS